MDIKQYYNNEEEEAQVKEEKETKARPKKDREKRLHEAEEGLVRKVPVLSRKTPSVR